MQKSRRSGDFSNQNPLILEKRESLKHMGRTAGTCDICGRTNVETFRCRVCGNSACRRCFIPDVSVCSNCVRKGFWVESPR